MPSVMATLLVAATDSAAQGALDAAPGAAAAPSLVLQVSPAGVRALDAEFAEDLRALGAFDGRSRVDRYTRAELERPKPWTLYGRLGVFNFQGRLEPQRFDGVQLSLRRTGPSLTGRYYVGIHRQF